MRPVRGIVLAMLALALAACATGGPAGTSSRRSCAEDHSGPTGLHPMFFVFCMQSP